MFSNFGNYRSDNKPSKYQAEKVVFWLTERGTADARSATAGRGSRLGGGPGQRDHRRVLQGRGP